ncbi:UDP-N-acetylmuramate dehydrogenase [Candidatus Microgenomates bacterium]|nr:UDP-N-acetylmuramate dehydrogenase [Candidatus Microgenomates bacterium]
MNPSIQIKADALLSNILWYHIGGKTKYLLVCQNKQDIVEAIAFIQEHAITKVFVCGQGTNLIFTDEYFDGVVIQLVKSDISMITLDREGVIEAFGGEVLGDIVKESLEQGLIGLEWAGGLPGTVGAGVRGNVGAYGKEVKDSVLSAEVLDFSGDAPAITVLSNRELQFIYRGSIVKSHKKMVVISARFGLTKGTEQEIAQATGIYQQRILSRQKNHPLEYPNCGSVFKNLRDPLQIAKVLSVYPDFKEDVEKKWYGKVAVAALIDRWGLKGYRVGDAQISEKHALFIVNLGHATANDVLQLIDKVQEKCQEEFGFQLALEVEVVA